MTDDPRCCGSGTCIIDPAGRCWCGQQWDGEKMSAPALDGPTDAATAQGFNDTGGTSNESPDQKVRP